MPSPQPPPPLPHSTTASPKCIIAPTQTLWQKNKRSRTSGNGGCDSSAAEHETPSLTAGGGLARERSSSPSPAATSASPSLPGLGTGKGKAGIAASHTEEGTQGQGLVNTRVKFSPSINVLHRIAPGEDIWAQTRHRLPGERLLGAPPCSCKVKLPTLQLHATERAQ